MADIVEVSSWETGIYQIEQTDPVLGGPPNIATGEGLTNVPIQQLANRTVYLLDAVGDLDTALTALENTLSAADFTDILNVSGISPLMQLTETDEGAASNQAGLMLSNGELFVQAETGIVRLTGWSGADMTLLTAKFAGVDQPIIHGGMLAAVGIKGIAELATSADAINGVEASKIMTPYRTRQAFDAHPLSPRAFVNFDMNGGVPVIASSQGVASVSQSSSGVYQINWDSAFASAGYAVVCTMEGNSDNTRYPNIRGIDASYVRVGNGNDNGKNPVCVVAFGELA